jgi:predicted secreted protein
MIRAANTLVETGRMRMSLMCKLRDQVTIMLFGVGLAITNPVLAQNQLQLGQLEPGQIALNLNLTEQRQVEQDTLNAMLEYTVQGRDQSNLQDEVNRIIGEALDLLRDTAGVEFNTGRYQVSIIRADRPSRGDIEDPVWRARQTIQLKSLEPQTLLAVAGQLQESGLALNGLYYSLSPALHESVSAELLQSALGKLQGRAEAAAGTLGKSTAALVEVSMDASPNFAQPFFPMAMEARAGGATAQFNAPQADPGESMVSVTISARAILSP